MTIAASRASPTSEDDAANREGGMVTVEAAIALCTFMTVVALVLTGMSMMLDEIRCTDAAREAARLVAMGERSELADVVRRIAPGDATYGVTEKGDGIVVTVTDPAAAGLLPGVRVSADAYAVPEPGASDDSAGAADRSERSTEGGER